MKASQIKKNAKELLKGKWKKAIQTMLAYFLINFAISFIMGLFNIIPVFRILVYIADIVIAVPLAYGFTINLFKLFDGEEIHAFDFFTIGFGNFKKAWNITLHMALKLIAYIIALIALIIIRALIGDTSTILKAIILILYISLYVVTIIKALSYVVTFYFSYKNPELSGKELVQKSEEIMNGNKKSYFFLCLSFIGWVLLAYAIILVIVMTIFFVILIQLRGEAGSIMSAYTVIATLISIGVVWAIIFATCLLLVPYIQASQFVFFEEINKNKSENV